MNPTRYNQHQHRADHRCYDDRPELRFDDIEIQHQRHTRRHKEEA